MKNQKLSPLVTFPHCYAHINHKGKNYDLIFRHPNDMLRDPTISWESKGYLSYIACIPDPLDDFELSLYVLDELIATGYLKEVENE